MLKEDEMLLYFTNDCRELRLSAMEYFEMAYLWAFKTRHPCVGADYHEYLLHSTIPRYAVNFIKERQSCKSTQPSVSGGS